MAATVITVSTRHSVADFERMARRGLRVAGVAQLAARTANRRQCSLLARVGQQLAADPELSVTGGDHADGYTYVTVFPAGSGLRPGIWGEPMGVHEINPH